VQSSSELSLIGEFIRLVQPDVACVQELMIGEARQANTHGPDQLAGSLGYECTFVALPNLGIDGKPVTLANAVLTRGAILDSRCALLSEPGSELGYEFQSRGYIEAKVAVNNSKFLVGTVHLGYSKEFEMTARRVEEAGRLLEQLGATSSYVLTGDFNAVPDSYVVQEVGKRLIAAGPDYSMPTWTTKPFTYNGFSASKLEWRLDYVFTTPDVRVKSARILESPYSDHLPILCELDLT
jgi:endonuclease/exonuclease/phosphatase family metal-dependent hydrolase